MNSGYYIGLDIGGTQVRGCLTCLKGQNWSLLEHDRQRIRTSASGTERCPEDLLEAIKATVMSLCARNGLELSKLDGIGVGLAGQLDKDCKIVLNGPNLGWRDVPFGHHLDQAFPGIPCTLANDLTAITKGEHAFGALRGVDHGLVIFVGTGVGSGLWLDSKVYAGFGNNAGELGHIKVVVGGRQCGCGQRGCLEAYCGGRHLEERITEDLASGAAVGLREIMVEDEEIRPVIVDRAFGMNLPYAKDFWNETADMMALTFANMATIFNPRVLLLGGGVFQFCPNLAALVKDRIPHHVLEVCVRDLRIEVSNLWDEAGVLGAASIAAG